MKNVVIVGGGFGGAFLAKELQHDFSVTLVDTKPYFEFTPSILRAIVEPTIVSRITSKHTNYLPKASVIVGKLSKIFAHEILVGKKRIPYDILVLALGSRYKEMFKAYSASIPVRLQELKKAYHTLKSAKSVIIVGGGVVGVELAAEIADRYPEKKITLLHSKLRLLDRHSETAQAYAEDFLRRRNVQLHFDDRVILERAGVVTTQKGSVFRGDLVFFCTGIEPNSEPLHSWISRAIPEKFVHVEPTLQVLANPRIFALGDLTHTGEEKTAQAAEAHARLIARNIRMLFQGKTLSVHRPKKRPYLISLGSHYGIFDSSRITVTGRMPALLKQFVEWKTMRKYRK